ncbi:MAG: DUF488 domain-containing protein [Kyrpidia sp.]|nr:DUF488 domain-containing protein [Kyrpidia sp.]
MADIRLKRVYEPADLNDGKRILVDRLWPRGLSKAQARVDEWMREVAPSPELRRLFGHRPERFPEFRRRYEEELQSDPEHKRCVEEILRVAAGGPVTLVYAARDPVHNHAAVLLEFLRGFRAPVSK